MRAAVFAAILAGMIPRASAEEAQLFDPELLHHRTTDAAKLLLDKKGHEVEPLLVEVDIASGRYYAATVSYPEAIRAGDVRASLSKRYGACEFRSTSAASLWRVQDQRFVISLSERGSPTKAIYITFAGTGALPVLERLLRRQAAKVGGPGAVDWPAIEGTFLALSALGADSLPVLASAFAAPWCDPDAAAIMEKCLDDDAWLRLRALDTLSDMGGAAVPTLVGLLSDADPWVRGGAAGRLGLIGPEAASAASSLRLLLGDPNADVRSTVEQALKRIEQE